MRRRAFTLVEMMVAVGVIVVLLALLAPSMKRARENARSLSCASNVGQIAMGMQMYAADNDGTMPTSSDLGLAWSSRAPGWVCYFYPSGGGTSIEFDHGAFMKYLGQVSVRRNVLRCVEADTDSANYSYVLPDQLGGPSGALMHLRTFRRPGRNIVVVEMNGVTNRFDGHFNIHESGPNGDEPADHHFHAGKGGFGNHGFADGHVETLSRADVDDYKNLDRFQYTK